METYIYKMIALSAIFILLYFVFLEKEKNHHFKRFYLLISALFSVVKMDDSTNLVSGKLMSSELF